MEIKSIVLPENIFGRQEALGIKSLGFRVRHPDLTLEKIPGKDRRIVDNLQKFAELANGELLDKLVEEHQKPKENLIQEKLIVIPTIGMGWQFKWKGDPDTEKFYSDGKYGFVLASESKGRQTWLAGTSFRALSDPNNSVNLTESVSKNNLSPLLNRCPCVVQLQVCKFGRTESAEIASKILNKFRWEKLLVHLVGIWSDKANFPALFIQPGKMNKYTDRIPEHRLKMRYDVTAKRSGFSDLQSGLYVVYLADGT